MPGIRFMRPADLWRRSSFRLAATITLCIIAALLLASGVGFGLLHAQLNSRQDARVTEMFNALQTALSGGDQADLVESITARIAASPDTASVYLLKTDSGQILAGNITDFGAKPGWAIVSADQLGILTDYPYRIYTGPAGANSLSVGLSDADLDDLREMMAGAIGWAALIVLVAAFGAGVVLAQRMDRRLALVDGTMARVAQGDLSARLPLSSQGDDLDQIATTINAALFRLEAAVQAMRHVSTDIAHDLRTPLNRLRIRIEAAAVKASAGAPVATDLASALEDCDQISEIFSALLRIAQIESGTRQAQFRTLDLAAVMADVADVYRAVAQDAGLVLTAFTAPVAQIKGDAHLLTQMFANLIENAIHHCPLGTHIQCGLVVTETDVMATIADTGPGVPVAERDHVLRRLYRLEKSRATPSAGLGLSLVKAIADLHHAKLALTDSGPAPVVGLTVTISFPKS